MPAWADTVNRFCCPEMAHRLEVECALHADPYDCPDAVVVHNPARRTFGLPVHDGGRSFVSIRYCPWCGERLPEALADLWEAEMRGRGFDPDDEPDDLPPELEFETWMRADAGG